MCKSPIHTVFSGISGFSGFLPKKNLRQPKTPSSHDVVRLSAVSSPVTSEFDRLIPSRAPEPLIELRRRHRLPHGPSPANTVARPRTDRGRREGLGEKLWKRNLDGDLKNNCYQKSLETVTKISIVPSIMSFCHTNTTKLIF